MTTLLNPPTTNSTNLTNPTNFTPPPTPTPPHPDTPILPTISLPPGQLTLLIGDPGTGKSLLALDLAARLSRHRPLPPTPIHSDTPIPPHPDTTPRPRPIILYSAEDSRDTILHRALAAGADLHQFRVLTSGQLAPRSPDVHHRDSKVPHLLAFLHCMLKELGPPVLLIIDPLPALLGTADSYHAAKLRATLAPLLEFALATRLPLLGITHLAKPTAQNKDPLHRIIGSLAYSALARAIYHLTPDPRDPSTRLVIPLKHNLLEITHAYQFTLENVPLSARHPDLDHALDPDPRRTPTLRHPDTPTPPPAPRLKWNPIPIPHSPGNPLAEESAVISQSQLEFASDFLTTTLKEGPLPSATLLRQSRQLAISQRTLERAKLLLRITSHYDHASRQWLMSLPG